MGLVPCSATAVVVVVEDFAGTAVVGMSLMFLLLCKTLPSMSILMG